MSEFVRYWVIRICTIVATCHALVLFITTIVYDLVPVLKDATYKPIPTGITAKIAFSFGTLFALVFVCVALFG